MLDPLNPTAIPVSRAAPAPGAGTAAPAADGGFAAMLRSQLDQASRMQSEAATQLEQVLTGQSDQLTDVFVAARKAEVAFSLLLEIRNKLVESYQELQNMRI